MLCRVSLGSESRIYEIRNPRFLDWNETPLVLLTCSGCGLGVVHYVHSVKFSHISPSDYQQFLRYRIQLRKVLLSCRKQIQLDIQIEVFHLPNHTQPPCFSTRKLGILSAFPSFPLVITTSDFLEMEIPTGKLVNTTFRAQRNAT